MADDCKECETGAYCSDCGDGHCAWRHLLPSECVGTTGHGCDDPSQHHAYERYSPDEK